MQTSRWLFRALPKSIGSYCTLQLNQNIYFVNKIASLQSPRYSSQNSGLLDDNIAILSNRICNTVKTDSQKKEFLSKFNLPEKSFELFQSIAVDSNLDQLNVDAIHKLKININEKTYGVLEEVFSGTCSSKRFSSNIKCMGCGAFLQCYDRLKPGFISLEQMHLPKHMLPESRCKRCSALQAFDLALGTAIGPKEFKKLIASQIKSNKRSAVIAMIDVTDFDDNTLPELLEGTVHHNSQVILVGNKFDLLPPDSGDYDVRIRKMLQESASFLNRRVKRVHLISAKTGFGIEQLISSIQKLWRSERDIYLIGAVNVGKSSLFNLLFDSDLSESTASGSFQKATVSMWPGTTLNTLKFPLQDFNFGKMQTRKASLARDDIQEERFELNEGYVYGSVKRSMVSGLPQLRGTSRHQSPFEIENSSPVDVALHEDTRWFHDTPGVLNEGSILPLLDHDELKLVTPSRPYIPRIFSLSPQQALTFGGLGRIDYTAGDYHLILFVFSSPAIPVVIATIEDTTAQFQSWVSSGKLKIPSSLERHNALGSFHGRDLQLSSQKKSHAVCDIVFASAGWVTVVMPDIDRHASLKASCLHASPAVRKPLLESIYKLQGKRRKGTPKFEVRKDYEKLFKYGKQLFIRRKKPLSNQ